jgi:hypothetical protein
MYTKPQCTALGIRSRTGVMLTSTISSMFVEADAYFKHASTLILSKSAPSAPCNMHGSPGNMHMHGITAGEHQALQSYFKPKHLP